MAPPFPPFRVRLISQAVNRITGKMKEGGIKGKPDHLVHSLRSLASFLMWSAALSGELPQSA